MGSVIDPVMYYLCLYNVPYTDIFPNVYILSIIGHIYSLIMQVLYINILEMVTNLDISTFQWLSFQTDSLTNRMING